MSDRPRCGGFGMIEIPAVSPGPGEGEMCAGCEDCITWTERSPEERQRILHAPIRFQIIGGQGHGGTRFTDLGSAVRGRRVQSPIYDHDDGHWNDAADDPNTAIEGDE